METIMKILGELEYLEGLLKLARRRKDERLAKIRCYYQQHPYCQKHFCEQKL
jgi:hypothetical protein